MVASHSSAKLAHLRCVIAAGALVLSTTLAPAQSWHRTGAD